MYATDHSRQNFMVLILIDLERRGDDSEKERGQERLGGFSLAGNWFYSAPMDLSGGRSTQWVRT